MRISRHRRPRRPLSFLIVAAALLAVAGGAIAFGLAGASRSPAVAATAQASAVTRPLIVGLADGASGYGGASTAPRLSQMVAITHTRWLRDPLTWSTIEPRPNQWSFSYYDHYMLELGRQGLHVVAQLLGAPRWAGASAFAVPADPTAYARYVAAVLHRYGVNGTFWRRYPALRGSAITAVELWNEPYFDNGNAGRYDPGRYARLVRAATTAARAVDPSVKVLIEAEMESHYYNAWRWWVDSLYLAMPDLNRYFDGVAVHDLGNKTDVAKLEPIVAGIPYGNFGRVRRIEDLRRQFVRHHAANKPFWIMEFGWSTCRVRAIDCVSSARQRSNLNTFFDYVHTRWSGWVQAAFDYRFQDGPNPAGVQDAFGLIRRNGQPKPSLSVFRPLASASAG